MSLTLPLWLPPIVVECAAGRFPRGNEDELRRIGNVWSDKAEDLRRKAVEHEDEARSPSDASGEAATAIRKNHKRLAERHHKQATYFDSLARGLFEYANTVELMKITVIGILVILAVALARCALMFAYGGAIEAAVQRMAAQTAIQKAWKKALQFLAGRVAQLAAERGGIVLVGHAALIGALQGGGLNVVAQGVQVLEGNRDEIDRKAAGVATASGVAGGMVGLLFARWLGPKVGAYTADVESKSKRVAVQLVGTAAIGGLGGIGGAIGGTAVSLGLTGEAFTTKAFAESMLPGLVSGAVIAGGYAARDIGGTTPGSALTGDSPQPNGPSEVSTVGRFDELAAHSPVTSDRDPNTPAAHQQQIDQFVSALRHGNADVGAPRPALPNNSGDLRPTGPVTFDLPSGVTSTVDPSVPVQSATAPKPVKFSTDPVDAPAAAFNSKPADSAESAADNGANGWGHNAPVKSAQTAEPRTHGEPATAPVQPGHSDRPQQAGSGTATTNPAAEAPAKLAGADTGPGRADPADGEQAEALPHPGRQEAGELPPERQRGVAAASGDSPKPPARHDEPASPVPTTAVAETDPAQQNPTTATGAAPAVVSEPAPAGPRSGSAAEPADQNSGPVMTVISPESPAPPRSAFGQPTSTGDGAGRRTTPQPTSGEAPPAPAGRNEVPTAGGGKPPPVVSAPKSAAAEKPPVVESGILGRGSVDDVAAQQKTTGADKNSGEAPPSPAREPENQKQPTTTDENDRKMPAQADEPEPNSGRVGDDSADQQQAKTESDTTGEGTRPKTDRARVPDNPEAPPAARNEDPAADVRAKARAEVEQRIAGERQQNELVREHHRQRVAEAAERERGTHTELKRQVEAVRVAEAHERATRLGPGDRMRGLSGQDTAADRVAVEASRAAQEQLRQAQSKLTEYREVYEAAVAGHDTAARASARALVKISDGAGVSLMNDLETGVLTDRDAVFDVVAQERARAALEAGRAIGGLRDPGGTADGTSPMTSRSPESLVDMMVKGSKEERVAAMTEWIRRGDDRHRLVRETQVAAFLLLEHGPVDMKTGEGKTIVMVMKMVTDAIDHGTAYAWTSSDLLAGELVGELQAFAVRPESDTGIDVLRMDQDGPLPDPVSGRPRIIVGTKEDNLFRALKVADSMMNDLAATGMSHQEVTALRDFLNTKPSIDLIKERLDTAASHHGLDLRFDPFPRGKLTIDEFDTIFDGNSECVLSPGAAEKAPPEVLARLEGIWDRMAVAEREHGLTAADFKRPENTRGMWAAETTPEAVAKLDKVAGAPVTVSELKLFADAANARWGLEKGTHYVTRADEGGKIGILAHETNDKAMWDRTKSTEVRWQDVGQFVDLKEGMPVLANQAHSLKMSDQQLIGSELLFEPSGTSGTMKGVEGITYDLYGVGPVSELPTYYTSNRTVEDPKFYESTEQKLLHMARDTVADAKIVKNDLTSERTQTGRPQYITMMDSGEIRGDPEAKRLGFVDYLDTVAREQHGNDFELRIVVVDPQFYAQHGGSNVHSEALVRQRIEEFGKPGDIFVINKEGGRGADPTPTEESIALGGVLGKTSGGPAFSQRVNDQVDGRVARGGSGDDRKNGGTPGTTVHYISPEDFRGRVTDHGVTQQIIQYTQAAETYRLAQAEHETHNSAATLDKLNTTEAALRNAESDLWQKTVPAMQDAVEKDQLAIKYASAKQANAPPADTHGTATQQPQHPPPQTAGTAAPHTTGAAPQAQHAPAAVHHGTSGPTAMGLAAGAASNTDSGNPPAATDLRDEHGDSTLRHLLQLLDAPGGQAAAPLLPVAQAVRDATFERVEAQGVPIGTNVADHLRESAQNLLDTGVNQLDPAQRRLVTDIGTALQQGRAPAPAQAAAVTQLVEQVRTAQPIPAEALYNTIPFDLLPAHDRTEMLQLAQQGDRSAGQALDRHFGPATAQGVRAALGWDVERGTPPAPIQALAHAVARATLGAAEAGGWQVSPGMDIGDWLLGEARNTWLDGHKLLSPAAGELVTDALNSQSRDDLTDAQVALFGWVAQEITVRAADPTARRQRASAEDRTTRAKAAATADSEQNTKQAIARKLFETYGLEVLGLDKPGISVDTALSIRNAIVDGYAARKDVDDIQLDIVLLAPMVGNIGGCIWSPDIVEGAAPTFMVLNEDLFGDPERFQATMRRAVQAGRLMAPTGDPAYDAVSHEMGHLQDRNARQGRYDKHPMDHSRIGPVRKASSKDSKEARAFGYLFSHFTELRKFGSLPAETRFDDWLGQLDEYSSGKKKSMNPEEDRQFQAFESWLSRFESRAGFDEWLRESGVSRGGIDDRRQPDSELMESDDGSGWVDLETVYKTWLHKLDENTLQQIRDSKDDGRPPARRDPDAERLGLGATELELGALKVFNPAEALAEANNAFGRTAPADPTHPAYALQALLRGVSFAQVLKEAEQRNTLVQADYRGPVPAASEFGASIASKGPTASVSETWRSKTPAERADFVKQQVAYLNSDKGSKPGFVLDELVRLEKQQRADLASQQGPPVEAPGPATSPENSSIAEPRSRTRAVVPVATDLGDEGDTDDESDSAQLPSVQDLVADPEELRGLRQQCDALRQQLSDLSKGRADLSTPAAVSTLLGALLSLNRQNKLNTSQARALPLVEEYSKKSTLLAAAEQVRGQYRDYKANAARKTDQPRHRDNPIDPTAIGLAHAEPPGRAASTTLSTPEAESGQPPQAPVYGRAAAADQLGLPPSAVTSGSIRLAITLLVEHIQAAEPSTVAAVGGHELARWIGEQLRLHADQEKVTVGESSYVNLDMFEGAPITTAPPETEEQSDPLHQVGFHGRRDALDHKLRQLLGLKELGPPHPATTGELLAELHWAADLTGSSELAHLAERSETLLYSATEHHTSVSASLDAVQIRAMRNQLARALNVEDHKLTRALAMKAAADDTVTPQIRRLAEQYGALPSFEVSQKPIHSDVALLAGVHASSVSAVVNGRFSRKRLWHGETTQRILVAAQHLGILPDGADVTALIDPAYAAQRLRPARWVGDEFVPAQIKPQPSRDAVAEAAGAAKATVRDAVKGIAEPDDLRLVRDAADKVGFWYHPDGPMGTAGSSATTTPQSTAGQTHKPKPSVDTVAIDLDPDEPETPTTETPTRSETRDSTPTENDDPDDASSRLSPSARRALEAAEKVAADVIAEVLRPIQGRGVDVDAWDNKTGAEIEEELVDVVYHQGPRFTAALRRLVADEEALRALDDATAITQAKPEMETKFRSLARHIDNARSHLDEVKTALAMLAARDMMAAAGAEPVVNSRGRRVDGVWVGPSGRLVVASPFRGQQSLLDMLAPGEREKAERGGTPIEYRHVLIGDDGQLTVETVSGYSDSPEPIIRYYFDRDNVAWIDSLLDERSFADKLEEARRSGERSRQVLKEDSGDETMSEGVVEVTYKNGYIAIEKTVRDEEQADAEELGALVLRAVGALPPAIIRTGERTLFVEFVPGIIPAMPSDDGEDLWIEHADTPGGIRQGLGDTLLRPPDRHEGANWMLERGIHIRPIDNSLAFRDPWPLGGFTEIFATPEGETRDWVTHNFPTAEMTEILQRLEALRPDFARLGPAPRGRLAWHDTVLGIFSMIEDSAETPTPRLDRQDLIPLLRTLHAKLLVGLPGGDAAADTWPTNPQQWRQAHEDLERAFADNHNPSVRSTINALRGLTILHLRAQLDQVSAEELGNMWEYGVRPVPGDEPNLLEAYLDGLQDYLAYLGEGATYPGLSSKSNEEWQERFAREIAATEASRTPEDTEPPTPRGPDTVAIDLDDSDTPESTRSEDHDAAATASGTRTAEPDVAEVLDLPRPRAEQPSFGTPAPVRGLGLQHIGFRWSPDEEQPAAPPAGRQGRGAGGATGPAQHIAVTPGPSHSADVRRAVDAVRTSLAGSSLEQHGTTAGEMVEVLLSTAEGTAMVRTTTGGQGDAQWVVVEIVDQSRTAPARDKPDPDTGVAVPTETGRTLELLDEKARTWGLELHNDGTRTRRFTLATSEVPDGPLEPMGEPILNVSAARSEVAAHVGPVRTAIYDLLRQTGWPEGQADDIRLAISEFFGNIHIHAPEGGGQVRAWLRDTELVVKITDSSRGVPTWNIPNDETLDEGVTQTSPLDDYDPDVSLEFTDSIDLAALMEADAADPDELGADRVEGTHDRGGRLSLSGAESIGYELRAYGAAGKDIVVKYQARDTDGASSRTASETVTDAARSEGMLDRIPPYAGGVVPLSTDTSRLPLNHDENFTPLSLNEALRGHYEELVGTGHFDYLEDRPRNQPGELTGAAWTHSAERFAWEREWLTENGPRLGALGALTAAALEAENRLGLPNTAPGPLLIVQQRPRLPGEMLPTWKLRSLATDDRTVLSAIGRVARALSNDEILQNYYLSLVAARPILGQDIVETLAGLAPDERSRFRPVPRDGLYTLHYPGCRSLSNASPEYLRTRFLADVILPEIGSRTFYKYLMDDVIATYQRREAHQFLDGYSGRELSLEDRIGQWFAATLTSMLDAPPQAAPEILRASLRAGPGAEERSPENRTVRRFIATVEELLAGHTDLGTYLHHRNFPEVDAFVADVRDAVGRRHPAGTAEQVPFIRNLIGPPATADRSPTPRGGGSTPTDQPSASTEIPPARIPGSSPVAPSGNSTGEHITEPDEAPGARPEHAPNRPLLRGGGVLPQTTDMDGNPPDDWRSLKHQQRKEFRALGIVNMDGGGAARAGNTPWSNSGWRQRRVHDEVE